MFEKWEWCVLKDMRLEILDLREGPAEASLLRVAQEQRAAFCRGFRDGSGLAGCCSWGTYCGWLGSLFMGLGLFRGGG